MFSCTTRPRAPSLGLKLITPPATTPVSLLEARSYLKIDSAAEDATITALIAAATGMYDGDDGILGRALVSQTWDYYLDAFPWSDIKIPLPPLISVGSVNYFPPTGPETAVASSNYTVDTISTPGWIVPKPGFSWPTTLDDINVVRIQFTAGYATIPAALKTGLLRTIGQLYENRDLTNEELLQDPAISSLVMLYRASWF